MPRERYVGVLVLESMFESRSSSGSWWPAREDCVRFFNSVCWAFQQKHLINRLWRSINHPPVSDPCSYTVSVFECVSLCFFREFDACWTVGIQSCLLNYICTKTTGLHTRRASLPASQQVGQPPYCPTSAALSFFCLFLFTSLSLPPSFFIDRALVLIIWEATFDASWQRQHAAA